MPKTLTVILLVAVCALAAAAGGYVAMRQSSAAAVSTTPPAAEPMAAAGADAGVVPAQAAAATEAMIPESPAAPAAPAPSTVAPLQTATPAQVTRSAQSATSSARVKPAPAQPAASSPDMDVAGQSGMAVATSNPVSAEPPVLSPPATRVSAFPDPAPPLPMFEEVVIPAESVLGLQVLTTTSTDEARVEDPVEARVTRDVRIGGTVAIPAGTRVLGEVTVVDRGGKVKGKARLGVRFHTLVLADFAATRVPVRTDTIFRESESQGQQSAVKIGAAAAGGAILGAIIGGGKGAVIGGAIGAGGGTASVMSGDRSVAALQAGTAITVRLQDAVTVTIER